MYGNYDLPFEIKKPELEINITKEKFGYRYIRNVSNKFQNEFNILSDKAKIVINPVEPCNFPQKITNYLMLEFKNNLFIAPNSEKSIFVNFPVEIGIFLITKNSYEQLDVVSMIPTKYTLYGDPRSGVVARYFQTDVYDAPPALDPMKYGILDLKIKNPDSQWYKISKLVLNAYDMKLKFNSNTVKMHAQMKINNEVSAETDCYLPPLEKGFKKSKEIFRTKRLSIVSNKFTMLEGI